ncbi:hypothetical protein H0W80_02895 [Candidatus Saccharibacteria bacterium]|nr:hypothetical protein [Candidatus Saccharibacteria bacterium]
MHNKPGSSILNLSQQIIGVYFWQYFEVKIVKIVFLRKIMAQTPKKIHIGEFGENLTYPCEPPNKKYDTKDHVEGLTELCFWLEKHGFEDYQQGEILIGVCEAYVYSLFPGIDFSTPYAI